jgi:hypothetical protein
MTESMLLIPGYLHPIPLHQDRQCHKAKTDLMPARSRGLLLLHCLIQPALRKSYLSLTREVCRSLEAYKIPGRSRCKDVYTCGYAGLGLGDWGADIPSNQGVAGERLPKGGSLIRLPVDR